MCVLVNIQITSYLFKLLFESLLATYFIIVFFHISVVNIFVVVKVSESMAPREVSQLTWMVMLIWLQFSRLINYAIIIKVTTVVVMQFQTNWLL